MNAENVPLVDLRNIPRELHNIPNAKPDKLLSFIDAEGRNWLMIAAMNGWLEIVRQLLDIGFDENSSNDTSTAISLAYDNSHYDVVLHLLNNNAKFPANFYAPATRHDGLIAFMNMTEEFHRHIRAHNDEGVLRVAYAFPHLRRFFSLRQSRFNESAATTAIRQGAMSVYDTLLSCQIMRAPDECFERAIRRLSYSQCEELRLIHTKHAHIHPESHVMVIQGCIYVGHDEDECDIAQRLKLAQGIVQDLNENAWVEPLLKLVARAGGFKIILDFNQYHTRVIDPSSKAGTRGVFYTTRHIYIGAKGLLSGKGSDEYNDVCGTILHEICHFALVLLYNNDGLPYAANDERSKLELDKVLAHCGRMMHEERIIKWVFADYQRNAQRAEILVRVPQLLARYGGDSERLKYLREIYSPLFDYYELRIVPDMERAIPVIGAEVAERRQRLFDRAITRAVWWKRVAMWLTPLCLVVTAIIVICNHERIYKWETMTDDEKNQTFYGLTRIDFNDEAIYFHQLFNSSSSPVYNRLSTEQISTLIKNEVLELSEHMNYHLREDIYVIHSNITDELMPKLLHGHVIFQGVNLAVRDVIGKDSDVLELLNASQIRELLLNKTSLEIGMKLPATSQVFIERMLTDRNETLSDRVSTNIRLTAIDSRVKDFVQLSDESREKSLILLADEAGMGKTEVFKRFAIQTKEGNSLKWVAFVELKDRISTLEKLRNTLITTSTIPFHELLNIQTDIERKVFDTRLATSNVVFFWDGFDEISPKYTDIVLPIFQAIRRESRNIQWVSTRPLYGGKLSFELKVASYRLLALTAGQCDEFLDKFFASKLSNQTAINRARERVETIAQRIEDSRLTLVSSREQPATVANENRTAVDVKSPLLLGMLAEVSIDTNIADITNLYKVYERFFVIKMKITSIEKGDIAMDEANERQVSTAKPKLVEIYQYYAIKEITKSVSGKFYGDSNITLEIEEKQKVFDEIPLDEKSREGILTFDTTNRPKFSHRTFGEFFLARFAIEYFFEATGKDISEESLKHRVYFFFDMLTESQFEMVRRFLLDYVKVKTPKLNGQLRQKLLAMWKGYDDGIVTNVLWPPSVRMSTIVNVFNFDRDLLREVLISDKNETIVTRYAIQQPERFVREFAIINATVNEFITNQNDSIELISGRHQRAKLLLVASEFRKRDLGQNFSSEEFLRILNIEPGVYVQEYRNCRNFREFYQLISANSTTSEKVEVLLSNLNFRLLKKHENFDQIYRELEDLATQTEIDEFSLRFPNGPLHDLLSNYSKERVHSAVIFELICYLSNDHCSSVNFNSYGSDPKAFNFTSYWTFTRSNLQRGVLEAKIYHSFNLFQSAISHSYVTSENFEAIRDAYREVFNDDELKAFCREFIENPFSYRVTEMSESNMRLAGDFFVELFSGDQKDIRNSLKKLYEREREAYVVMRVIFERFFANEDEVESYEIEF